MNNGPADRLAITVAQLNPTVGDVAGNLAKARKARARAAADRADLIAFTELFVAGYPPEDLVLKPAFQAACRTAVEELARETADGGPAVLIGTPWVEDGKLYNAYCLLDAGGIAAVRLKVDLPNYGVFDEKRVFTPGPLPGPINFRGVRLGIPICEDIWGEGVVECLAETGAELMVVPNGSPYWRDKDDVRLNIAVARVTESDLPMLYVNQVGGQDELIFDGASFALHADRSLAMQLPAFCEAIETVRWERAGNTWRCVGAPVVKPEEGEKADYAACVLGLRDYVEKNRFPGVVLGLSGGIDSALTAAIAVDALGPERVHAVMMPSPYTSPESLEDAEAVATLLGIDYRTIGIEPAMAAFGEMLEDAFAGKAADITEENIQSRARGMALMALSNKFGWMVVSTGNKSEMSVGYATLYGDMCGGYAILKDVYKMTVFALSRLRNEGRPAGLSGPKGRVMPERVISKPPSAELKPNQRDEDSLPPYAVLDDILECLIEHEMPVEAIVARGHDEATVRRVWLMLDRAEYKRRQAPPGVKITRRAFGRDRRYPITNRFQSPASTAGALLKSPVRS